MHRLSRHPAGHAFTLVEVLLVLGLLVVLMATLASASLMTSPRDELDHSAEALAGTMRMAMAESALQGRRFRLAWDEESAALKIEVETEPLAAPGTFSPYTKRRWARDILRPGVAVASMALRDDSAINILDLNYSAIAAATTFGGPASEASFAPIVFYPDGRCDASEITLRHTALPARRALLTCDAITSTITIESALGEDDQ
ncbi:MAG: hypothetical protein HN909_03690 [Phycisphaerales bacterium]|jgi:type II secretory pathway pseudopilin PulG|nr:hypothetical protein [Phycisphaerales bacterium]MBT7170854.1 hypothetical protein [Phycisphaerales bacterium]